MNRYSFEEGKMARVLLLVSREQPTPMPMPLFARGDRAAPERAFTCKTCGRVFPSFQALGGHRASHKKPRLDGEGAELKPKMHACSICGLEFAIGQALGGHMRRHRAMAPGSGTMRPLAAIKKPSGTSGVSGVKLRVWLDLNYPPCGDDGTDHHGECGRSSAEFSDPESKSKIPRMEGSSKSPTLETWVMEPVGEAAVMDPASDARVAESASSLRAASSAAAVVSATSLWDELYSEARRWIVRTSL